MVQRRLYAAARDLAAALFGAGPDSLRLGPGLNLHRALGFAGAALMASLAVALLARALTPAPDPDLVWYVYGSHDERWLALGYWLAVASALCVPLWAARRRSWWIDSAADGEAPDRTWPVRVGGACIVYTLWLGPPWNVELLARPMEWHELVHLGPLQALLHGRDLYLEAGTQYGPGLQMLSLQYLERFGVSLVRFREFWLWTNFAGGLLLVAWLARLFPVLPLLAGLLILRFFSPFGFFSPDAAGSYEFYFGWASCIRYAGAIHAVLAVAAVLARRQPGGALLVASERVFLLLSGMLWGVLVLVAQENLGCGIAGLGLLAVFALSTRAAPLPRLAAIGGVFALGVVLALTPMLLLFAVAGELPAFVQRYFEIGGYVLRGYSGTPWREPWLSPLGILYTALAPAAAGLFTVAAFDVRRARAWRIHAAAAAAVTLACFAMALLRSDGTHVQVAVTPLAFLVAAALSGLRQAGLRPASAPVLILVLLPALLALRPEQLQRLAADASGRIASLEARTEEALPVGDRVGYRYDLAAPYSVFSELPLGEFLELSRRLREKVGPRPVVVSSAIGMPGHWYFFADLVPLMPDPEPSMTIVNSRLRARYLAQLEARGIPCVISTRPGDAEVELFRRQPGGRDEWILESSARDFFVGCRRATDQAAQQAASRG